MKKLFFSALALTAVLASCTKESEIKTEQLGGTPIEIKVTLDEETKTAYAGEKTFSWVAGDVIAFEVEKDGKYDVISLTTEESGTTVSFKGTLPDGYTATGRAFYPKPASKSDYYSSGLGIQEDGTIRMWGTITPDLDNPMASIPLVGKQQTSGDFKFITACGIIKVTVENIPSDAYFFQLDAPSGTALNGNFTVGDDQTIKMANVSGTPWPQKYVSFTPQADKETRTFYIPIPVGTVPAGTKAQMRISGGKEVLIAETKSDIPIVRNKIIDIGTISYPSETWTSLGVGKFRDNFVFPFVDLSGYVEREFFQSSLDANVFRITQPYPGTNSGEWFVFDVTDPTKVKSDNYFVDIEVTDAVAGKATFKPWIRNGVDYGYKFSKVLKTQTGGLPACIEIGPCYRGEEFSTAANPYDYEIGRDNDPANYGYERGTIEIVFPGCEPYSRPPLAGTIDDVVGTYTVAFEDYWNSTGTTSITIAASDDSSKGNIMITEFAGHGLGDPSTCAYTYGTYASAVMTFAATKTVTPLYIDGNGAGHVLASYDTDDVVFTVDEPGVFHSSVWIVGNRWETSSGNGFDTFWTKYEATRQ